MNDTDSPASPASFKAGMTTGSEWRYGKPLPVAGCLIMFGREGSAELSINSHIYRLGRGDMAFLAFDMVVVPVGSTDDFEADFLSIDFEATQDLFFLVTSNRFWDFIYRDPVFALPNIHRAAVRHWFSTVCWISDHCGRAVAEKALRNEAENLLLVMADQAESRLGILGENPSKNRAWIIINDFLGLLNRHYTRYHDVAFYAAKLNITPNYLNIIVKRYLGNTAKEQINLLIGLVAKTLLDTTDLSVKEIAVRLGYDDPSYLCRIFRKLTGQSPIGYRNMRVTRESDSSTPI